MLATRAGEHEALAILERLFGPAFLANFSVRLWDGSELQAQGPSAFTLRINDPGALRAAFRPPVDLNAGRAFASGLLDIEGDIEAAIDALYAAASRLSGLQTVRLLPLLRKLPRAKLPELREAHLRGKRHSIERDRAAIGFHYDQPVEFYQAFLDENLVYSCAYYDDGIATLGEAQLAKIDHILRKLRLQPGETLLDIGCGWGSLVLRAAQKFGAHVLGVTLSRLQFEEAQRRIAAAGLAQRAQVAFSDYRRIAGRQFDKIVSVGMFEHVGRERLSEYFRTVHELLRPGGLFLNHGIANQNPVLANGRATGFMDRLIFPDGELVRISEALTVAEATGFEVRDVENLREHYARTLRAWVANIERNKERAIRAAGEQSYNAWRLYMAGSAQGFRIGRLGLFQSLLAKPRGDGAAGLPATRRDLYRNA
jgi:cyclopropane-fatty-acyl-phospholipid synthase